MDFGGSSGTLLLLLVGGLVFAITSAYRTFVNMRTTERGLVRQHVRQASQGERAAQREAGLWQARCADLEYLIRVRIGPDAVPDLSPELRALVLAHDTPEPPVDWGFVEDGRPRP